MRAAYGDASCRSKRSIFLENCTQRLTIPKIWPPPERMTQKLHQQRRPRQNDGPEIRHLGGRFFFGVGNFWKFSRNKAVTRRKVFLESLQCLSGNLGKGQYPAGGVDPRPGLPSPVPRSALLARGSVGGVKEAHPSKTLRMCIRIKRIRIWTLELIN